MPLITHNSIIDNFIQIYCPEDRGNSATQDILDIKEIFESDISTQEATYELITELVRIIYNNLMDTPHETGLEGLDDVNVENKKYLLFGEEGGYFDMENEEKRKKFEQFCHKVVISNKNIRCNYLRHIFRGHGGGTTSFIPLVYHILSDYGILIKLSIETNSEEFKPDDPKTTPLEFNVYDNLKNRIIENINTRGALYRDEEPDDRKYAHAYGIFLEDIRFKMSLTIFLRKYERSFCVVINEKMKNKLEKDKPKNVVTLDGVDFYPRRRLHDDFLELSKDIQSFCTNELNELIVT